MRDAMRRRSRRGLVAAYVVALAVLPSAASLGQSDDPAIASPAKLEKGEEGHFQTLSWQTLAGFDYQLPDPLDETSPDEILRRSKALVPQRIRALDGKDVALRGFVIPLDVERGRITSFVLAATNQIGCCFGDSLFMNEWVIVDVPKGQTFECKPFELATVLGKLHVGEDVQDGFVMSLYRMLAQKIRKG
jgi:hypothetical protein